MVPIFQKFAFQAWVLLLFIRSKNLIVSVGRWPRLGAGSTDAIEASRNIASDEAVCISMAINQFSLVFNGLWTCCAARYEDSERQELDEVDSRLWRGRIVIRCKIRF